MAEFQATGNNLIGRRREAAHDAPRIPVVAFGLSLGLFFATTFALCVGFDLLFPNHAMYQTRLRLLPGFVWLNGRTSHSGWSKASDIATLSR